MRAFENYNPIAVFVYFVCVSAVTMFCMNPLTLTLSLLGAVSLYTVLRGVGRFHFTVLAVFAVSAVINPLFYHNGMTVLFIMNNNPVTLEAVVYGIFAAVMIASIIYWFGAFSHIMTSDRLLYLFGAASPRMALLLSMILRYIPLFTIQTKRVNRAQRALGLYKDDNPIDGIRGGIRIFSIMLTWGLENGIITADSMTARGYGCGRRTSFSLFRFRKGDVVFLIFVLTAAAVTAAGMIFGALDFKYYPRFTGSGVTPLAIASYTAYGILVFIPVFIEAKESIRWKYLKSKI